MHDDIRKFNLEGTLGDSNIVDTRQRLVEYIEGMLRDYSYVPSLDNEPQFTLDYDEETETYKFTLTVYGVKVSKEQAWSTAGVMNGKPIPKAIAQTK